MEDGHISIALSSGDSRKTPVPDGITLGSDDAQNSEMLRKALRELKDKHKAGSVVVGLGMKYFAYQFVNLPVSSRRDLKSAIPFEMERHLPLPPDEYVMDFIAMSKAASTTRCLVFALIKDKTLWIENAIKEEGLRLKAILCSAVESVNAMLSSGITDNSALVLKDGGRHYVIGIEESLPVSIKAASGEDEVETELERLSTTRQPAIYCAGSPGMQRFGRFEAKGLLFEMPFILASSSGRRAVMMDFKSKEHEQKRFNYYNTALIASSALSIILYIGTLTLSYYRDRDSLRMIEQKIAEIQAVSSELIEAKKELEAIDAKMQFLLRFQNDRNRQVRIFTKLSSVLPESSWLTNYSSDQNGRIEIQGHAKRTADIIGPLESADMFKNVQYASPVIVREGMERFSITMEFSR